MIYKSFVWKLNVNLKLLILVNKKIYLSMIIVIIKIIISKFKLLSKIDINFILKKIIFDSIYLMNNFICKLLKFERDSSDHDFYNYIFKYNLQFYEISIYLNKHALCKQRHYIYWKILLFKWNINQEKLDKFKIYLEKDVWIISYFLIW